MYRIAMGEVDMVSICNVTKSGSSHASITVMTKLEAMGCCQS